MADNALAKKLLIKPGHRVLVLNAPDGDAALLGDLPEGASMEASPQGTYDVVQAFAHNRADVDRLTPVALRALRPGGVLWFCYPKGSSKVKTDITRDKGWDAMWSEGWVVIAQVSLDDTWSAGRFRPLGDVKSSKG